MCAAKHSRYLTVQGVLCLMASDPSDPDLRANAASFLGDMGGEARSAIPVLEQLLCDPAARVRAEAMSALSRIANVQVVG